MAEEFKMTAEGKEELKKELDYLKSEGRIDIAEKLKVARSYGDLSENSEYDEAKSEQAKIEARISELEYQLEHAVIVENVSKETVSMGSTVTIKDLDTKEQNTFTIVNSERTDPANGRISDESPVGKALIDSKVGDKVDVETPMGAKRFKLVSID